MDNSFLRGTGVALVTPFNEALEIDYPALERVIDHVIDGGVNYVVVLGTTGEPSTLELKERQGIFRFVREYVHSRVPLVAGLGGNNTRELAQQLESSDLSGFRAVLSASPYYNKPSQEGIYQHYKTLAASSPVPVIIYNVPARTASNITSGTTLRLAHEVKNIAGIKEASGLFEQFTDILAERPSEFIVVSGDDALALPMIALGADGLISVAANALPGKIAHLVECAIVGDLVGAQPEHYALKNILSLLFREGNPAGVKSLLHAQGLCKSSVRMPLVEASAALANEISHWNTINSVKTSAKLYSKSLKHEI